MLPKSGTGDRQVPRTKTGSGSPSGHPDQTQVGRHRPGERTNKTGKGKARDIRPKRIQQRGHQKTAIGQEQVPIVQSPLQLDRKPIREKQDIVHSISRYKGRLRPSIGAQEHIQYGYFYTNSIYKAGTLVQRRRKHGL